MQTGVIIRRNAKGLIPEAYLTKALEKNPTGWGAAIVTDGKLQIAGGDNLDLQLIQETIEMFKDSDITFYLCNSANAINADDIGPFTILHHNDEPQLVAFIEGKFPGYEKAGSSHPSEFHFAHEYLIPKMQDIYDMADGNLPKVMEHIKKPYFKGELLNSASPRGVITLVSTTGETLTIAKAEDSSEYSWGWVSQNYGYALAPPEDRTQEVKKPKGMFSGKSTVREKAPASSAIADAVKPAATSTATNIVKRKEKPEERMSRSSKKDWYKQRIGYLPKGWQDSVEIEVYANGSGKLLTNSEVKKLGLTAVGLPTLNNPPQAGSQDTVTDHVHSEGEKKPVTGGVTTEVLPILPPSTREHIKKILADSGVQKIIGENADIISDPRKVAGLEAKFADFATQMGMKKIDDFMGWSYEMMLDLAKAKPDGIAVMCWTFRNMLAGKMAKEATKTTVQPEVKEEVPAPKRGMFTKKAA